MSNPSRQKYIRQMIFITPEQRAWVEAQAVARNPARYGARQITRTQSPVLRDVIDFARTFEPLFLHFVATREQNATGGTE